MVAVIYKATNLVNGKVYVGKTTRSLNSRQLAHFQDALYYKSTYLFHNAIRKYGKSAFAWEIVARCCTEDRLNQLEVYWIAKLGTFAPGGYNLTTGGEGGFLRSEETRAKMSKSLKAFHLKNPGFARERLLGHFVSEETRRKFSEMRKGVKFSAEARINMGLAHKGLKHTEESKAKISAAKKGKPRPDAGLVFKKLRADPNYVNPMKGKSRPDLAERNRQRKGCKMADAVREKMRLARLNKEKEILACKKAMLGRLLKRKKGGI